MIRSSSPTRLWGNGDALRRPAVKPAIVLTQFSCPSVSIDAYRSTRMKEMERPGVKQVIVRKENVGPKAEEPKGTSVFSIRQKMKVSCRQKA